MRNYLFACLEAEARLALLAQGCDPQMGCLHADQRNRDSLALYAMEPVRADVDGFLLELLEDREFTARDFGELPNGICRIAAPFTHELALTLPHWRECLRPIAARLAQIFRESLVNKGASPRTLAAKSGINAVAFRVRSDRRCSQRLAKPRSRDRTLREHGERRPWKHGQRIAARMRDVRRAGAQAQAPALRCMHAKGSLRAWFARDCSCTQGPRSTDRSWQ